MEGTGSSDPAPGLLSWSCSCCWPLLHPSDFFLGVWPPGGQISQGNSNIKIMDVSLAQRRGTERPMCPLKVTAHLICQHFRVPRIKVWPVILRDEWYSFKRLFLAKKEKKKKKKSWWQSWLLCIVLLLTFEKNQRRALKVHPKMDGAWAVVKTSSAVVLGWATCLPEGKGFRR